MQQPIENALTSGEKVVYRGHRHWVIFLPCVFWAVISMMFLTTFVAYKNFAIVALIMTLFYGINRYIDFFLTEIVVTNKRLLLRMGFIRHLWAETLLDNIVSFECNQTFMGRLFDYGTLTTFNAGKQGLPIANVSAPLELKRQIQIEIERLKKMRMSAIQNITHS